MNITAICIWCNEVEPPENHSETCAKTFKPKKYNYGWISVEDELPKQDGRYLVYGKGETVITRFYSKLPKPHFYYTDTTHWMPLPEPPK